MGLIGVEVNSRHRIGLYRKNVNVMWLTASPPLSSGPPTHVLYCGYHCVKLKYDTAVAASNGHLYGCSTYRLFPEFPRTLVKHHQTISELGFLGAFAKLQKSTICFVMCVSLSVHLSVLMEKNCSHWMDFNEPWYLSINLIVAPCIFVESLQFINERMHI